MIVKMATATVPKSLHLQDAVPQLLNAGRQRILIAVFAAIPVIAFIDWHWISISLGGLYLFPILLAATVLKPREILTLALVCAVLRCLFDDSHYAYQYVIRFSTSFVTYVLSGLFIVEAMSNRRMALEHVAQITKEQRLRSEAQERLKILVQSSPAAIFTLDAQGIVLAANHAANLLFGLRGQTMEGRSIKPYLATLSDALRMGTRKTFRTSAQAQGRRENGEIFLADLWFSTYSTPEGTQLAAIVVDSSEELRDREQENLRQLSTSSRLVVGAVLHEIRNLCSAISVVYSNLKEKEAPCRVDEIHGLETLVRGLGRVASLEMYGKEQEPLDEIDLQEVLDDLRIIIEPGWAEINGAIVWDMPDQPLRALADRYGLLQVFLNLAQNSHRAVQGSSNRRLTIRVNVENERALIFFQDTGCGIADPQHLFQPFQKGADVTGLGLFISRALVRGYGGELRFIPAREGCCFAVELPRVGQIQ
jgi:two-component system sensor kinase FixL